MDGQGSMTAPALLGVCLSPLLDRGAINGAGPGVPPSLAGRAFTPPLLHSDGTFLGETFMRERTRFALHVTGPVVLALIALAAGLLAGRAVAGL